MIKKLVRQMLPAQIISALAVSVCLMIDSIMIGRFLKETAMAAYGLANPLLMSIGAIALLMTAGIQVACSKSLGRGSQEETNAGFSSALAAGGCISLFFMILVVSFRGPLASLTGAERDPELFRQTKDYLLGFAVGAPACMGALVLVPFLQMAGRNGLLIAAIGTMMVLDIGLDLLNVFVWHGGMLGMGLASSASYYAALLIGSTYFFTRESVFRFRMEQVSLKKIGEMFRGGVPTGVCSLVGALLTIVLNKVLAGRDNGVAAVAALSVISTVGGASNCITTGASNVSLTLSGILAGEEDREGLWELIRTLCREALILGAAVGAVLALLAPTLAELFLPEAGEARDLAVLGMRLFALGLIPSFIMGSLRSAYQGMGRVTLMMAISVAESLIIPLIAALTASVFLGTKGLLLYFCLGETLSLAGLMILVAIRQKKAPWRKDACLLLEPDFGVAGDALMEAEIHDMKEVSELAERAGRFCARHGQSETVCNRVSLCVEEMAANTIKHGFSDGKPHQMNLRIQFKGDRWVIRFRDDCRAFDPVHYVPAKGKEALGIHLVLALAEEATYTYAMNLNNLTLRLRAAAN